MFVRPSARHRRHHHRQTGIGDRKLELGAGSACGDRIERRKRAAIEGRAEHGARQPFEGEEEGFHRVARGAAAAGGLAAGRAWGSSAAGVQPSQSARVRG